MKRTLKTEETEERTQFSKLSSLLRTVREKFRKFLVILRDPKKAVIALLPTLGVVCAIAIWTFIGYSYFHFTNDQIADGAFSIAYESYSIIFGTKMEVYKGVFLLLLEMTGILLFIALFVGALLFSILGGHLTRLQERRDPQRLSNASHLFTLRAF